MAHPPRSEILDPEPVGVVSFVIEHHLTRPDDSKPFGTRLDFMRAAQHNGELDRQAVLIVQRMDFLVGASRVRPRHLSRWFFKVASEWCPPTDVASIIRTLPA